MKKVGIVALVLVLLVSLGTTLAYGRAQKLNLRANPLERDVPAATEAVAGFAILNNDNEMDEVVVVVSLKDGIPNESYGVFLEDYNGTTGGFPNWLDWTHLGDLTTNIQGNGNLDARVSRSAGTYYLQVVVSYPWGSWDGGSFGTDIAEVVIE